MNIIEITIPEKPKAQQRHRDLKPVFNKKTNKWFTPKYDPSAKDKKKFLLSCMLNAPKKPIEGPVKLFVRSIFKRPDSHYGKDRKTHHPYLKSTASDEHICKPDADNLLKFIKDALTGVFWTDDCQIYDAHLIKEYDAYENKTIIEITY